MHVKVCNAHDSVKLASIWAGEKLCYHQRNTARTSKVTKESLNVTILKPLWMASVQRHAFHKLNGKTTICIFLLLCRKTVRKVHHWHSLHAPHTFI